MAGPVYLTPTELLTRAPLGSISRAEIPGPEFAGKVGMVTHAGASTGTLRVQGFPIDAQAFVARVKTAGDLGVAEFEISTDGGVTFADAILTEANSYGSTPDATRWTYAIPITGVLLIATNGSGSPNSFLAGDSWTWTTTASPRLLQLCQVLSDYFRKWALNTAQSIDSIDEADKDMLCEYGRWKLVAGRGEVPEDWKRLAENAYKHFRMESLGDIHLNSTPDPDGFTFPTYEQARDPFRYTYPGTNRPVWRH